MNLRRLLPLTFLGAALAFAQDPPSRVARLNFMSGNVSFQPSGLDTWTAASLNYPLTTGDHIYTDSGSRAEMHVGPNAIRLNQLSNFGYFNLDDRTVQMRFTEGAMEVRVKRLEDNDLYEIDTPQGAISLLRGGDYRIDTDPERNATMVTVRSGEAEVTANGQATPVHPRQTAYFSGDNPADIRDMNPSDDFDRFTNDRNRREDAPPRQDYVPSSMVGAEDLYTYGSWREYPGYGRVWVPPMRADWAPYRYGHWAWVDPWGWTWIDDAPWGFAPFHYGRWAHVDVGWIWCPGPVNVRPVYAPALVAFVGGPGFRLSVGVGGGAGVAWFPLGPREIYRPVYHGSPAYVNRVNVTNVTNVNVTNVNVTNLNVSNVKYVNQTVPGAVTAVPQQAFVSRQSVHSAMQPVNSQDVARAQVVGSAPAVAPQRESLMGMQRGNVPHPAAAIMERQVVARQAPPPPAVPFQARQQALAREPGRPVAPQEMQSLRSPGNARPVRMANAPSAPNATGAPNLTNSPAAPNQPVPANRAPEAARPPQRLDSRPPNARPIDRPAPAERPAIAPQTQAAPQPRPNRPDVERPEQRPHPVEASRPAPEQRPVRPDQKREPREEKKERRDERKDERKEEKKQP